jgi:hypothetical protein
MLRSRSRRAALFLSGGTIALTGAMLAAATLPAQAATTPGWRISATTSVKGEISVLLGVDAVSAKDAWAVGFAASKSGQSVQALVRHWAGKRWSTVTLPAKIAKKWNSEDPFDASLGVSSPTNVWMFSPITGKYLRLNGKRWSLGTVPGANPASGSLVEITSVRVFSSADVWAFGGIDKVSGTTESTTPYAAHFTGRRWTVAKVPGTGPITAASATSSRSIWAVTGTVLADGIAVNPAAGVPGVLHWTLKAGWKQPAQPVLPAGAILTSVLAEPGGKLLVGGSEKNTKEGTTPLAAKWSGKSWTVTTLPGPSSAKWALSALAPDGKGGTWALAQASNRESGRIWHLSGHAWSIVKPNFGKHTWVLTQLAAVPHTDSVWAVGALKQGKTGAEGLIAVAGPTPR